MSVEVCIAIDRGGFRLDVECQLGDGATGLFGPSGAGKTTLLHAIAGLARPRSGRIAMGGEVLFDAATGVCLPPHRRRVGVVFQEGRLFPHLDVRHNLTYGMRLLPRGERRFSLERVAAILEIEPLLERRVQGLSGGERRRVTIGRAVLASPRLLLLDEPLTGLDVRLKGQVLPFLRRVRAELGIPLVYVSHHLDEVLRLTDDLVVLDGGAVRGHGRYHDLVYERGSLEVLAGAGLQNVLPARAMEHRPDEGVTLLALDGDASAPPSAAAARIAVPAPLVIHAPLCPSLAPGSACYALLRPEDIALADRPLEGLSVQNQIAGTLRRATTHRGQVVAEVTVAGRPLLVEVTRHALTTLAIAEGSPVRCLFKANAVGYGEA